ncbi:MAG: DinB family protein [Bacteroidetes bacterium]|nr:DinB family protein [Bacteroidota bacterium]
MNSSLQKQFDALEKQRLQLLREVSDCPIELLNKNPQADKWSINQIIQHLILAEELSQKSIKAKLLTGKFESAGMMTHVRTLLLKVFLRSSVKFKAPVAVSKIPENLALEELYQKWEQSRRQLNELLESIPQSMLNKYIFKHPVAGKMNLHGGLAFMQEHVRRHAQQIKRIIVAQK